MKNKTAKYLASAGIIAALYAAISFQPYSSSAVQVRIAEALTVLPVFTPAAVPGLFIGCFVGNLLQGAHMLDVIFGSLTSLVAAILTRYLRKNIFAALAPPVVLNAVFVGMLVQYCYGSPFMLPVTMLTVGAGQVIACYGGGLMLYHLLKKNKGNLFD